MAFINAGNHIRKGLKKVDQKLDKAYKSCSKNDQPKSCQECGKEFTWHTWRNKCACCDGIVCRKCLSTYSETTHIENNFDHDTDDSDTAPKSFAVRVCHGCWEPFTEAMESMIVVRSGHVGGHITKEVVGNILTEEYRDFDGAEASAKFQAYSMGANAIMKYRYTKYKNSKPTESGGTYYYSTFSGHGLAVVVEPKK